MARIKIEYPIGFSECLKGIEIVSTEKADSMNYNFSLDSETLISIINIFAAGITISDFVYKIVKYVRKRDETITLKTSDHLIVFNKEATDQNIAETIETIKDDLDVN